MSHKDISELDNVDLTLHQFFHRNISITDSKILNTLHDRYKGSGIQKGYRGLLFHNKEQLERFMNNLNSIGAYSTSTPSSISLSKDVAHTFSVTTPTYDDVDSYRASAAGLKRGEWVSGYEGLLIELEFEGADCIDLSLANLNAENELLLLPNAKAKILSITHNVPYHRQFAEGMVTIDDIINTASDSSDPRVNYIIENLTDQLSPSLYKTLFELANDRQEIKTNINLERYLDEGYDIFKRATSLNQTLSVTKTEKINGKDWQNSIYIHPNGLSVRESIRSDYENYKRVEYTTLVTDFMVPSLQIQLVEKLSQLDPDIFGETHQVLKGKITSHCNQICQVILDATELEQFKAQEIDLQLATVLKNYAHPFYLESIREAIHPNRGQKMRELNDMAQDITTKEQLSKHTDEVIVAMTKLINKTAIAKPTTPKP